MSRGIQEKGNQKIQKSHCTIGTFVFEVKYQCPWKRWCSLVTYLNCTCACTLTVWIKTSNRRIFYQKEKSITFFFFGRPD